MKKNLYFAYGSNLNSAQMKKRCPDSVEISNAVLSGWKLTIHKYADIERAKGECVNGALYEISQDDLMSLDCYEGYPEFYTRETVMVTDHAGNYRQALAYIMTQRCKAVRMYQPCTETYRSSCSAGAEYWGIPNAFIPHETDAFTLWTQGIPSIPDGIDALLGILNSNQPLPRAKRLWLGARVAITLKPQNLKGDFGFYPAPYEVTVRHAVELSWLFYDLRDLFIAGKMLDSCNKFDFFRTLAETASAAVKADPEIDAKNLCRKIVERANDFYMIDNRE